MSDIINQNTEPLFIFDMPDDEVLSQTISVQGEKGERGDPTKTSQLINDSDYTTNAALTAGLATKADLSAYQTTATQVAANTAKLATIDQSIIDIVSTSAGDGRWYPIATLPVSSYTSNEASLGIRGKMGVAQAYGSAHVDIVLSNRGGDDVLAYGDYNDRGTIALERTDFVAYKNQDDTVTIYLHASNWFNIHVNLEFSHCENIYDANTYLTTEPSGVLIWSLSQDATHVQKTRDNLILSDINGNAATVNHHTVNADVPAGAAFTDTIYDDTAILGALDEKADTSAVAASYATKTELNNEVNTLEGMIQSLSSGAPLVVSSVSAMTDTTKTYVNTSDGYWYYYNGSAWTQGGVYQSTGLADNSVKPIKTTFHKASSNLINPSSVSLINGYPNSTKINASDNTRTLYIPCEKNTYYTVTRKAAGARFAIATTEDTPAVNVSTSNFVQDNTATTLTTRTGANSAYLVVWYWNGNYDTLTKEELLEQITVEKSCVSHGYTPYHTIEVNTETINDGSVTPAKTSFCKDSPNLFNWESPYILNAHLSNNLINPNNSTRSIYIPCDANATYTITKTKGERLTVGTTSVLPATGDSTLQQVVASDAKNATITTNSNAAYLVVFYYNGNYDTLTEDAIRKTIMVVKGSAAGDFVPYGKILSVETPNLADNSVTYDKISEDLQGSISKKDPLTSRNGVYGVQFDITAESPVCTRVGDAVGLKTDYVIDGVFQLNNGNNDFDSIFPWCDMRLCNLSFDTNGEKVVTYQGESGFMLDGTNGEVMVEIPKFYSMRERVGNVEKWAISGEPKSGFSVEPAFIVDGVEQDYVYVGAYNSSAEKNGVFTYSGDFAEANQTLAQYIAKFNAVGLQSYDLSIFLMLQKLITIEFGTRNIQNYMGGLGRLPYWTSNTTNVINGFGANYFTFAKGVGQGIMDAFWVGERIKVNPSGTSEQDLTYARVITAIEDIGDDIKVTYDGADLSPVLFVGAGVGCAPQKNGLANGIGYHTGRANFAPNSSISNYVSPMRYRYIENVYGNVWELISGLRVRNQKYYYSFEPDYNESVTALNNKWETLNYDAPLQGDYPSSNNGFIVKQGYDRNKRNINFPLVVGQSNGGGRDKYFGDSFYCRNASASTEYSACVGGAWDHYYWAGIFALRCWIFPNTSEQLYGSRAIYRG